MIYLRYRDRMCLFPRMLVVQATLYKIGQTILKANPGVQSVRIALPNKHYIPVDMKYIGIDNLTPYVILLYPLEPVLYSLWPRRSHRRSAGGQSLVGALAPLLSRKKEAFRGD